MNRDSDDLGHYCVFGQPHLGELYLTICIYNLFYETVNNLNLLNIL
jgi:hypothetical protein